MIDHSGHRARLKNALRENGLASFSPHEVIELMLYTALPRRDVNELAHHLDDTFGGPSGLLKADEAELIERGGLSPNAAAIIAAYAGCVNSYRALPDTGERVATKRAAVEMLDRISGDIRILLLSNGGKPLFLSAVPKDGAEKFIFSHCAIYDAASVFISGKADINPELFRACGIDVYSTENA